MCVSACVHCGLFVFSFHTVFLLAVLLFLSCVLCVSRCFDLFERLAVCAFILICFKNFFVVGGCVLVCVAVFLFCFCFCVL